MLNQDILLKLLSLNSKAYYDLLIDKNFNKAIVSLDKNSVVLDIGANIGNVSSYIIEKSQSKIYAFEPNIFCFEVLFRRFLDNPRIKIFNVGVSNYSGVSNFYLHEKSKGINDFSYLESSSLKKEKDNISEKNSVKVNVINITEILSKFKTIDLIKIDVEGSEYEIVPFLISQRHKIKTVLCEFHGSPKKFNYKNPEMIKDNKFTQNYLDLINQLKQDSLYNNWLYEWH
jgi:FkbM family methyltransferase